MKFKTGDKVRVSKSYPSDRDYPIPHGLDTEMWGLVGTVVTSADGYEDDKYIFVMPLGIYNNWPDKERFDPLSYWHFLPEELEKAYLA